jgi:hypothetical protein
MEGGKRSQKPRANKILSIVSPYAGSSRCGSEVRNPRKNTGAKMAGARRTSNHASPPPTMFPLEWYRKKGWSAHSFAGGESGSPKHHCARIVVMDGIPADACRRPGRS